MEQELHIGRTYKCVSSRKGTFNIMIISQDDIWATGIITKGTANAIMKYNEAYQGDEITVRKELSKFTEL